MDPANHESSVAHLQNVFVNLFVCAPERARNFEFANLNFGMFERFCDSEFPSPDTMPRLDETTTTTMASGDGNGAGNHLGHSGRHKRASSRGAPGGTAHKGVDRSSEFERSEARVAEFERS